MDSTRDDKKSNLLTYLLQYKWYVSVIVAISVVTNLLVLVIPRITSKAINDATPDPQALEGLRSFFEQNPDQFSQADLSDQALGEFLKNYADGNYDVQQIVLLFSGVAGLIFVLSLIQVFLSNDLSEKIAARLRESIMYKLSQQSFQYIQDRTVSNILTNLTSDIDAIKQFITQGILIIFSSIVLLVGSSISLLSLNWELALIVISAIPILGITFTIIFRRINKYFIKSQEVIDLLNRIIKETIVGATLVRVLHSKRDEARKFESANSEAKRIGVIIVNGFAVLVPVITLVSNIAVLIVIGYGGYQVIEARLNFGDFAAFFSYVGTFILPIILLGFLGTIFTRAFASYERIRDILLEEVEPESGSENFVFSKNIELQNVRLSYDAKEILHDISLRIEKGKRTAIIGPTAAGKTQLLYLLTGLVKPTEGNIVYDGLPISAYSKDSFNSQIGMVFQDSLLFKGTIRENIMFNSYNNLTDKELERILHISELLGFVQTLEKGVDTEISERGASLSGGQKQRLILARALAVNPQILILDDFTSRVDVETERKIFENLENETKGITIISISQKIESVKNSDNIILLMEGEILAQGTHDELLKKSFEYKQIRDSQLSTNE